jgi:hypothetical protein
LQFILQAKCLLSQASCLLFVIAVPGGGRSISRPRQCRRNKICFCHNVCRSVPAEKGEMPMSHTRPEFPADLSDHNLPIEGPEPSVERLLFRKRSSRGRVLIAFCVGVAATLACQFFSSDATRETIASSYPQLGWLAPQASVARTVPDTIMPAIASLDEEELKAISLDLAETRQKVDQLAAQQEQMARDFTAKVQNVLDKISMLSVPPPAAPARRPAPSPSQLAPPLQVAPVH